MAGIGPVISGPSLSTVLTNTVLFAVIANGFPGVNIKTTRRRRHTMPDPITLNGRLSNITIGAEGGAVIPVEVNAEEIIRALAYLDKP